MNTLNRAHAECAIGNMLADAMLLRVQRNSCGSEDHRRAHLTGLIAECERKIERLAAHYGIDHEAMPDAETEERWQSAS